MRKLSSYFDLTTLLTSSVTVAVAMLLGFLLVLGTGAPPILVFVAALAAGLTGGMVLAGLVHGARGDGGPP